MTDGALQIRTVPGMGRGVFAGRAFAKDEVVEVCPVIVFGGFNVPKFADTTLAEYVFEFDGKPVIALGYGSLYNHSSNPNVHYNFRKRGLEVVFRAARRIQKDEQLFMDYGWNDDDLKDAWRRFAIIRAA